MPFDNGQGTCGRLVGINCYGCGESKCRPYKSTLPKDRQSLWLLVIEHCSRTQRRTMLTQLSVNGAPWTLLNDSTTPCWNPLSRSKSCCPAHVFSPPANISWRSWTAPNHTSIQGVFNKRANARTTLGANKGRCSFEYWLDDGPKAQQDSKGKAFEAKLLNPIPSWPHSKLSWVPIVCRFGDP